MDRPAAMVQRMKRSFRAANTGCREASIPAIIWGLTPRNTTSQPAASWLEPVRQPSWAARAWALAGVRFASSTSEGAAVRQTARARAPPMLPHPIKPIVFMVIPPLIWACRTAAREK